MMGGVCRHAQDDVAEVRPDARRLCQGVLWRWLRFSAGVTIYVIHHPQSVGAMHVVSVGSPPAYAAPARSARVEHAASPERAVKSEGTHHVTSPEKPRSEAHAGEGRAKGVLRLLQEGHFKGVADVRLRINFHEAITQRQTAQVKEAAREGVGAVVETVASEVNALIESSELGEDQAAALGDLLSTFAAAAEEAETFFRASNTPRLEDLMSVLQDAFDTLQASVQALFASEEAALDEASPSPAAEGVASADAPADGGDVDASGAGISEDDPVLLSDFLSRLAETFTHALEGLHETIQTTDVLPPLSEPNGNGKAYARFVSQYNELRSSAGVYGAATVDLSA